MSKSYPDQPIGEPFFTFLYRVLVGIAAFLLAAIPVSIMGVLNGWQVTNSVLVVVGVVIVTTVLVAEHFRLAIYGRYARSRVIVYHLVFPNEYPSTPPTWTGPEEVARHGPNLVTAYEVSAPASRTYPLVKRALDITIGAFSLLFFAPVLLVIAILIKLDSSGPVVYGHWRIGKGGKPFKAYKFRVTHDPTCEGNLRNAEIERMMQAARLQWIESSPWLTPVGRFLRRMALDELPLLVNVLRGDMTLVGPRADIVVDPDQKSIDRQSTIFELVPWVSPGLTGFWAVSGTRLPNEEVLRALELKYAQSQSLILDAHILLRTIPAVVRSGRY